MSCPSSQLLSRFVADGLDPAIAAHLTTCDLCSAEVEAHRAVSDDVHLLPTYEPSPDHVRDVRAALLAAAGSISVAPAPVLLFSRRRTFIAAGVLAAAAIALLVVRPLVKTPDITAVYHGMIHPHDGAQFIRVGSSPDEIVRLTRGTITVEVAKLEAKERFRVITDDSEVEVRGTAFDVTASNDHLSAVHVLHGKVEVRAVGSSPVFLGEGERWEPKLARTDEVLAPTAPDTAPAAAGSAADNAAQVAIDSAASTHGAAPNEPTISETTDDLTPVRHPRKHTRRTEKTIATREQSKKTSAVTNGDAKSPATEPPTTNPNAAKATQQIQTSQAQQPAGTPKRPNELEFDKGWQAMNSGNFGGAATAFEQAAKSAPNDPLAEDAWFWRASALTRAKSSSASGALDAFISRYPHSPRTGEASAMLGWLLLDRDTDRAEKLFTTASNDRVAAVRASGEKGIAAIDQKRANAK